MSKRLAYEATDEALLALADPGKFGYKSRNALINAAILNLVFPVIPNSTEQYRDFVKKLARDVQAVDRPYKNAMSDVLSDVIASWDVPNPMTDAVEILKKRAAKREEVAEFPGTAPFGTEKPPDVF